MRTTLVAWCLALAFPAVASAHGSGGHGYVSSVTRIDNANGIVATTGEEGQFSLTAPAGKTVVVFGYEHEPYLKLDGGRVFANTRSPTFYTNREEPPPLTATAAARPRWVDQASDGLTYSWHDHRTHWMEDEGPAAVEKNPHARHHIRDWMVDGTVEGERFAVHGSLDWKARKSGPGYVWISYVVIAGFVLYVAFALVSSRLGKGRLSAR